MTVDGHRSGTGLYSGVLRFVPRVTPTPSTTDVGSHTRSRGRTKWRVLSCPLTPKPTLTTRASVCRRRWVDPTRVVFVRLRVVWDDGRYGVLFTERRWRRFRLLYNLSTVYVPSSHSGNGYRRIWSVVETFHRRTRGNVVTLLRLPSYVVRASRRVGRVESLPKVWTETCLVFWSWETTESCVTLRLEKMLQDTGSDRVYGCSTETRGTYRRRSLRLFVVYLCFVVL